jgi:hypothetical protein
MLMVVIGLIRDGIWRSPRMSTAAGCTRSLASALTRIQKGARSLAGSVARRTAATAAALAIFSMQKIS